MKIASSSASFAGALAAGDMTQLEWLDLCANELEVDGVVFDAAHFPRFDDEYLAQLKKCAVDLGLTVAAIAADGVVAKDGAHYLQVACALGAPLIIARAPVASSEAAAWGHFTEDLKARARDAKRANVTLALRDSPATLCADASDLARATKDVDSAWVRFALDAAGLHSNETRASALAKAAIVLHTIADAERFATNGDDEAASLSRSLFRFRGFIVLDAAAGANETSAAYHHAIERFATLRATQLAGDALPQRLS